MESAGLAEERRRLAIDWATTVLRDQGPAPARQVLETSFGPDIAQPPTGSFARLSSLQVQVDTRPGKRTIEVVAAPRGDGEALIQELAQALQATGVATVTLESAQPALVRMIIPFASDADLLARQQALASATPPAPEWALLSAVLRPSSLRWNRVEETWRARESWEEDVSLVAAVSDLGIKALTLDQVAEQLDSADPLNALLAELWQAEGDVWLRLADNTHARFTLTMHPSPGAPVIRTWSLRPGEQARMTGDAVQYRVWPLALGALVGYALFMVITWRLWRRRHPSSGTVDAGGKQQPGAA